MSSSKEVISRGSKYGAHIANPIPVVITKGQGRIETYIPYVNSIVHFCILYQNSVSQHIHFEMYNI